ncbi:STAS domain-containing protein [Streptomyces sp. NPDC003758]
MDSNPGKRLGEQLRLTITTLDSRMVVSVAGEVDHLTAARLSDELGAAGLSGARWVEADFSRVGFCDCSVLNVLLAARSHFRVQECDSPCPDRLLQRSSDCSS